MGNMKQIVLTLSAAVLLQLHLPAQTNEEAGVGAAVLLLKQAMLDGDSAVLVRMVHPALSYGHSSGKLEDKASFVGSLASGRAQFQRMDLSGQTISVVGRTALVRHLLTGTVVDNGKPGDVKLNVLLVWVKDRNRWQLLGRQAVKVP